MKTVCRGSFAVVLVLLSVVSLISPARVNAQKRSRKEAKAAMNSAQVVQTPEVEPGSVEYLESTNGYGNLVLGADLRQMPEKYFSFLDNDKSIDLDSCLKYKYSEDDMLNFADGLKLDLVGLRAYNNRIVDIYLFFKADDGFKMLKALQNYFGQPTDHPKDFMYGWTGQNVNLQLRFETQNDLGVAIISSNKMKQEILASKTMQQQTDGTTSVIAATSGGVPPKQNTIQTTTNESMLANTASNPQ